MPTPAMEDYLKAIFKLSQDSEQGTTTTSIAQKLGIAAGSVSGMLKRLSEKGLVEHVPYYGARLTPEGEEEAVRMIRRHRILELFLVEVLGYRWDQVHEEAERLEHAASDELVARMVHVLGEPEADPHGDPIPPAVGAYVERTYPSLEELEEGGRGVVRRVSDEDAEALRYLAGMELCPGAELEVLERAPFNGPIRIRVEGTDRVLGRELSRCVRVEPLPSADVHETNGAIHEA